MSKKFQNTTSQPKPSIATQEEITSETPLFGKKNYQFMAIGLACIVIGYFLMLGPDANTKPDGTFDPNYWNEGIFSFTRIRLAPLLIVIGFIIEIYAILVNPKKNS